MTKVSALLDGLEFSAVSEILNRAASANWRDVLPLAGGEPRFDSPSTAFRALHDEPQGLLTKYSPFRGYDDLLDAIAKKLKDVNGITCSSANIVCVPGGSAALYAAVFAVVDPGSEIILSDPCWEHYPNIVKMAGAVPTRFRITFNGERWEPDLDSLQSAISARTRAILLNTPLNPCGAVLRREEITAILQTAHRAGIWVIVDEEYEAFIYDNNKHLSPGAFGDNVITLQSFSKTFAMTGIRLGYVVAPIRIVDLIRRYALYTHMYPPSPSQRMAFGALQCDYIQYMAAVRLEYQKKMERLFEAISNLPRISCWRPEGGVYLFPKFDLSEVADASDILINEHHLLCVPGHVAGDQGRQHVRFFHGVSDQHLDAAADRIRQMVGNRV